MPRVCRLLPPSDIANLHVGPFSATRSFDVALVELGGDGIVAGAAQPAEARQIAANDDARCQSYGAKPGSDAYVSCRMNMIISEHLRITLIERLSGSIY
jgi:hypothetical protein